ncbi:alcohol dehydrogenase [Bifidobacterium simiiventris]|uniref:alcohol dehydrogenase n=1 Tax=Bifidobacterium simiiventris TaxID=2834434 RepID=UPI001F311334|nr:alcohol dehydrogenase [Bifidobacterium simiiventris]
MTLHRASSDIEQLPWSYRFGYPVRLLITVAAGVGAAVIGTFAHRMGASMNIPYGLVLAYMILGLSTWCARSRCGITGLAMHLIASTTTAWMIAAGSGNDALTPIGFNSDSMPYFSQKAGYLWLIGMIIVQLAFAFMPPTWFRLDAPKTAQTATFDSATTADSSEHDGESASTDDAYDDTQSDPSGDAVTGNDRSDSASQEQ